MNDLSVCLVQADLIWEDRQANLAKLKSMVEQAPGADVYVLPEMFTSGFTMRARENANTANGEAVTWMKKLASKHDAAITGSLIIEENGKFYNRLFWVQPDETIHIYNKRHLFTLAGEEKVYTGGNERIIINYKGWRIMPQVCYDLRFPAWCRNTDDYDLLFFVANWPERRSAHWRKLLVARAIENQAYVVGVNRVGHDGNQVYHSGDSAAIDPLGEYLTEMKPGMEKTEVVRLNKDEVDKVRSRFGFLEDRDAFELK